MTPAPVQLAVFDLDGTITRRDTLFPYVMGFLLRAPHRLPGLLLFLPALVRFTIARSGRGELKSALIRCTMSGCSRASIDRWTARFVERLNRRGLFGDAVDRIAFHKRQGAHLVLLSASTDLYVPAIGRSLGFHETICTEVQWNGDHLDGHLTSENRRGEEKARVFESLRERHPGFSTAAYANAASDLEHLRLADRPVLVNGPPDARREAASLGIACVTWR